VRDAGAFDPLPESETEGSIGRRFETVAGRWPERIALETEGERLTYAELDAAADRVAQRVLAVCGPEPARVALLFERPAALVPSILGVLKAGAVYLPVDPSFPAARVAYALKDAEAGLVLFHGATRGFARDLVAGHRPLANVDAPTATPAPAAAPRAVGPDAIASLFYTSGSTGEPKGVIQSHRNLLQYARNYIQTLRMRPADRVSLLFSYSFSGSIPDIFGSLLCGATLCPFDVKRRGPEALARWVREREVTLLHLVPTLFRHLVSHLGEGDAFPTLRGVDLGGEAVYAADVAAFRSHFPPDCVLVNRLAATEASLITQNTVGPGTPEPDGALPTGHPVDGMEVRIEGPGGDALGPGEVGEIVLRSRFLSPGYWRKPELTARAFRCDPENAGVRLYRTGDRGRLRADGAIEHLGRSDQRVKIHGFTVELTEVELALRDVEGVRECAVVARGERGGDAMLVAFVLPRSDAALSGAGLRRALRRSLPEYAIPARIQLVEELPLTASGKIDHTALIGADPPRPSTAGEPVAPRDPVESELAAIWRSELGLDVLGVQDDYFALGGTSLQAVQIMTRIEERFARELAPAVLLEAPTIETLARLLEQDELSGTGSLAVALRAGGSGPPLFCFPGNGGDPIVFAAFVRHLDGDHPCYGLQTPGLVGQQRPPRRIDDHARAQLAAIRETQPRGPYFFVGFSFGSTVAFEIARRLRAEGERVALLAMIDGWAPGHPGLLPDAPRFHRFLDRWLGAKLLERDRTSPRALIYQSLKMRARDLECLVCELRGRPPTAKQRRRRRKRAAIRARGRHRPSPYDGPILLLRASQPSTEKSFDYDPLRGWQPFASGDITIREVPGRHIELLDEPHVCAVAAEVAAAIARAAPEAGPCLRNQETPLTGPENHDT
jgi:amino acid adenylation domain-containing protein